MTAAHTIRHRLVRARAKFRIREHKFLLLFLYLLAVLIYYPYVKEDSYSYGVFRILGSFGIFLTVFAIKVRRSLLICAILLGIPAVLQRLLLFRADAGLFSLIGILFSFAFDVFIVVMIFREVFAQHQVRSETVFGAICIYLLIGFTFASVYAMLDTLQVRAFYFDPITNPHPIHSRFDFVYYSFATMTSMGASGINPVSGQARSITVMETTLGVLYLAVLIARLMAAYRQVSPEKCD
jgi:hypothetical protein